MPGTSFVLPRSLAIGSVFVLAACSGDGPTGTPGAQVPGSPSAAVLAIGDLRRAMPQSPCRAAAHRQFDFWLGEWSVSVSGSLAGTNIVTSELDGCLVAESWTGAGGWRGWSLNTYDPDTRQWHQHWVDESGVNLFLAGGLQNGSMVIVGSRPRLAGGFVLDRITYTPLAGGRMRQFWESSIDDGETWPFIAFDGLYDPAPGVVPAPSLGTTSCAASPYRSADFLLGDWRVEAPNGLELGRSTISAELSGCLVLEHFSTPKGYEATAFLSYGRSAAQWSRTYVDTEGSRVFFRGTPEAGGLVLTGTTTLANGTVVGLRVTWRQTGDGSVEQVWEISRDAGATWSFDQKLVYVPA